MSIFLINANVGESRIFQVLLFKHQVSEILLYIVPHSDPLFTNPHYYDSRIVHYGLWTVRLIYKLLFLMFL